MDGGDFTVKGWGSRRRINDPPDMQNAARGCGVYTLQRWMNPFATALDQGFDVSAFEPDIIQLPVR